MDDACHRILNNLDGADLDVLGYHQGCYQNQDHLQCGTGPSNEPPSSCSSRKQPSSSSSLQKFPAECIFCEKLEVKTSVETEPCIAFAVFSDMGEGA